MNELDEITTAFDTLCAQSKPAALATVVAVTGSAYRLPGARMLVAEDGRTWGGVSGGCLEADVARRARGVIATGACVTCCYDTTDDQDLEKGLATGCRGSVDLFIEPLSHLAPGPLRFLAGILRDRQSLAMATAVRVAGPLPLLPATRFILDHAGKLSGPPESGTFEPHILPALRSTMRSGDGQMIRLEFASGFADFFVEKISPPQSLVIFGAGADAIPLVAIARTLGWHVTVVAARAPSGVQQRFAQADVLRVTSLNEPLAGLDLRADSAVILMTHNYPRDLAILRDLRSAPRYLGILGPRRRTDELLGSSPRGSEWRSACAPIGLDLGAQTPSEIALAIAAEIQLVIRNATGIPLRDRQGPIHQHPSKSHSPGPQTREEAGISLQSIVCPM